MKNINMHKDVFGNITIHCEHLTNEEYQLISDFLKSFNHMLSQGNTSLERLLNDIKRFYDNKRVDMEVQQIKDIFNNKLLC